MTFNRTHIPRSANQANHYATAAQTSHRIATNIVELKDAFELHFFLAGFKREDIQIKQEKNELVIEAKREKPEFEGEWLRREVNYGTFERRFTLTDSVKKDDIKANYENGVLTVSIPKSPEAQPRTIEIN